MKKTMSGFTIVELLVVIVVIAILASISVVAYTGIQNRARDVQLQNDMRQVDNLIKIYHANTGSYPSTGSLNQVYTDANCQLPTDSDGYKGQEWVPGVLSFTSTLPQNPGLTNGCYTYASDGAMYVLSAWNAKHTEPDTDSMYRRLGWREGYWFGSNSYLCNHVNIGGSASGTYNVDQDMYKHSYTISNITNCNETPPSGA